MIIATLAQLAGEPRPGRPRSRRGVLAVDPSPAPAAGAGINTDGIVEFIATKIAPILLAVLGVIFISRAGKGEMSKVLTSSAIAIVGLAFIAGAGALFFFGEGLIKLIFGVGAICMRLRTDDDIYRARLVYLGPPGYTLPIQLPYAQYGLFLVLVPLFMFIHYLFTLHVDVVPGVGDRAGDGHHVATSGATSTRTGRPARSSGPRSPTGAAPRAVAGNEERDPAARRPPGHDPGEDPVTRTEREGPGDGAARPATPDFADYYDDAPVSAPAVLRAPTPLGGVAPVRRPPADPRANPAVGAKADLDSPFLGLVPGRHRRRGPADGRRRRADAAAAGPGPAPSRRPPATAPPGRPPRRPTARPRRPVAAAPRPAPPRARAGVPGARRPRRRRAAAAAPARRRRRYRRRSRPRTRTRTRSIELALTEIAGHLTFTQTVVTAWYWLPEVRWAFRPDVDREALIIAISEQYAGLAGFRLHLRRTSRPFAADEWARGARPEHAPGRCPTSPARRPGATTSSAPSGTCSRSTTPRGRPTSASRSPAARSATRSPNASADCSARAPARRERKRWARTVEQFDEVLGAFGMRGRRVTAAELEWLLYRSVALGMSPPHRCCPGPRGAASGTRATCSRSPSRSSASARPYGATTRLVNRLTGEERHVAVLTVGRMEPLEIPERHEPWLHFHERLPWPMEISSRVDVLGPGDSFRNLEHRLRMIRSQQLDYAEHGMDAPPELERLAQRALVLGDEMTTGLPVDSSRVHGWHRLAVSGATREECLERARRVIQLYQRELRISLQHPKGQEALAREFIPGEPLANTGYLRRMPVKLLAAAVPQAASTVGDRRGDLIGRTAGTSRRPVFLDLHFPMEVRERSGLAVFVAEPGGGKSTLLGALGYLAARRGVQVTLLDPSGPLARLCQMPELRPFSRVLNLTGSEQGTLAPYALIPTPQRQHFAGRAGRRPGVRDRGLQRPGRAADAGAGHLLDAGAAAGGPGGVDRDRAAARGADRAGRGDVHTGRHRLLPAGLGRRRGAGTRQPAARHRRDAAGDAVLRLAAARHARPTRRC